MTEKLRYSVDDAEQLFVALTERHRLRYSVERPPDVELVFKLATQPGLLFDVTLTMQNVDELCIFVNSFAASYFPCSNPARRAQFEDAAEGLLSGRYRVISRVRSGWAGLVRSHLQSCEASEWRNLRSYTRLGLPFGRVVTTILQNQPVQGRLAT
jgi:hypothetical protein